MWKQLLVRALLPSVSPDFASQTPPKPFSTVFAQIERRQTLELSGVAFLPLSPACLPPPAVAEARCLLERQPVRLQPTLAAYGLRSFAWQEQHKVAFVRQRIRSGRLCGRMRQLPELCTA